ncbi:MAG: tetratricopeptide repeat protein [Nitrospirota bacterium]
MKSMAVRYLVSGAILAVLLGSSAFAAAAMGPKQLWDKGTEYASNRLFIDAVAYYTQAIRTNKGEISIEDVARIFTSRGLAYQALNDADKAIADFSNALELDDRNQDALVNRGTSFLIRREFGRAQQDFSKAIELNPRNAAAYSGRARTFAEAGSHDRALADLAKLLELEPRNVAALYSMGFAYRNKRQDDRAIEAFDRLLKIDDKHAASSYQKAAIYARQKKIDSACVWLDIAVADGYRDWETLKTDPDLDGFRKNSCYQKVMAGK